MDTTNARYRRAASALRELPAGQAGRTLDLLARMRDLTDQELHERTGCELSRTIINQKRSGRSPVRPADLWPLAEAVDVDVDVLLLPPSRAAIWLAEHRAEQLDAWESVTGRQGELSKRSDRQGCTAPTSPHRVFRTERAGYTPLTVVRAA